MPKTRTTSLAAAILAGGLIAGCGSASKTTTGPSPATTSSQSASSGPYGTPASSPGSSTSKSVALITTKKHGDLGTILAYGPRKMTVYLFEADRGGASHCTGACAVAWPPVTGTPKAGPGAMSADLGTITRPDGTRQLTYKGHPLYMFIKDKDGGDAYGQGLHQFGADWYVLNPSGTKVDKS